MGLTTLASRAVTGALMKSLEDASIAPWIGMGSMLNSSNQEIETYVFTQQIANMRRWIGARASKALKTEQVAVTSYEYEDTLRVSRRDRKLDKTGQVDTRIADLADGAARHWDDLLTPLLNNGSASLATYGAGSMYDGANFFGAAHRVNRAGNAMDNAISFAAAAGTRPTSGEFVELTMLAIEQLLGFDDEQGKSINRGLKNVHVVVPVSKMGPMFAGLKSERVGEIITAAGTPVGGAVIANPLNVSGFSITGEVNADLTNANKIFVLRTDGTAKALIRQEEEGLRVTAVAEGSEHEFKTGEHLYGVNATRGVGYGRWEHAIEVTVT